MDKGFESLKLKVAFFCGHKSPYGLAHLRPILDHFDVKVVIIGMDERWDIFYQALGGKIYYEPRTLNIFYSAKVFAKKLLPNRVIEFIKSYYQKTDNIRKILRILHIELWEIFDVNSSDTIKKLKGLDIDLFLSAAYPQIFSKDILEIPNIGAVNFHPALLPKYRGAHPHFWQILKGEKEGGLTAHFMTENIDDGDVIAQIPFQIEDCNYSELYQKLTLHTPRLVLEVRNYFENPTTQAKPQNSQDATTYRNEREIHCRVFWNINTSQQIYNLIRTEKAFCFFRGKKVIFDSSYVSESNRNLTNGVQVENGTIVDIGRDNIAVKTIDGCINIIGIKSGYKEISHLQWAKDKNISVGEKFD